MLTFCTARCPSRGKQWCSIVCCCCWQTLLKLSCDGGYLAWHCWCSGCRAWCAVLCCAVLTPLPVGWVAGAFFVCMRVQVTCQLLNLGSSCFRTCTLCCSCRRHHECMLPQQLTPTEPARAADKALWLVWSTPAFNMQHGCGDSRTVNVMCTFVPFATWQDLQTNVLDVLHWFGAYACPTPCTDTAYSCDAG